MNKYVVWNTENDIAYGPFDILCEALDFKSKSDSLEILFLYVPEIYRPKQFEDD